MPMSERLRDRANTLAAFVHYSPARHGNDDNMTEPDADQIERRQSNLRYLLNRWIPSALPISPPMSTTVSCPSLDAAVAGASRAEITEFLWYDLEDHFGLDPEACQVDQFADQLVAWSANWADSPLKRAHLPRICHTLLSPTGWSSGGG